MPWWLVLTDDELKASYPAAYAYLKARKVELPADFYARFEALRPEAWTVGKLAQLESIETVKKSLLDALKSGASFEDWQKTAQKMDIFPKHYREVVFRNAMLSSYNSAKWASFRDNAQRFPVLRYSAINDGRTRPAHSAMHGLMMPVNDPRWQTLAPPSGHNCRCTLQSLTEKQAKAYGYKGAPDKLPTYIDNKGIEQTVQADKGWHHSPELDNLDELLREREQAAGMPAAIYKAPEISKPAPAPQIAPEVLPITPKAPAAKARPKRPQPSVVYGVDSAHFAMTYQLIEHEIKANPDRSTDELRGLLSVGIKWVVATLSAERQQQFNAKTATVWLSDDTLVKQIKHRQGQPIGMADYAMVEDVINNADAHRVDNEHNIVFFRLRGAWYKAAVKTTQDKKELYLLSFRRARDSEVKSLGDR